MPNLKLRIKDSDFSEFAGFYYTDESHRQHNEVLDEYITMYLSNDNIRYLEIDCDRSFSIHTIAYICSKIECPYFIRTDYAEDVKKYRYKLCFYKDPEPLNFEEV